MKKGLLLINLGTPEAPTPHAIRKYLAEFLSDPRVITLPAPARYLLLYAFILPFRPKASAKAYQAIWTKQGSPLLNYSQAAYEKLQTRLGKEYHVQLAMCYGEPSVNNALESIKHCEELTLLPLYPQYASSSSGAALSKAMGILTQMDIIPSLKIIRDFYQHPAYLNAMKCQIEPYVTQHDYVLFSYHGVPENHLVKGDCKALCQIKCAPQSPNYKGCYRAQCYKTTKKLAAVLRLKKGRYSTSFQSRLGKTPWIQPYTDDVLTELANQGIKNLAVTCPAFVADCLETLEEIGIRAKEQWLSLGGETLTLIPSLNDNDAWIEALAKIIRR